MNMTREIKFRGKVKNNDPMIRWVDGYYLRDLEEGVVRSYIINCLCQWEVEPNTIGQYTGLKDKNGKEIYEGDIVRYDMGGECEVSYCIGGGFAGFDLSPTFHNEHQLKDVKVIGNIHDNPELLNKIYDYE